AAGPAGSRWEPVHRLVALALLAAPGGGRLPQHREIREALVLPRELAEIGVVKEPLGIAAPVDQGARPLEAGFMEIEQDGADGHDADLLRHEHRPPEIRAIHHEPAGGPLERDRVARL